MDRTGSSVWPRLVIRYILLVRCYTLQIIWYSTATLPTSKASLDAHTASTNFSPSASKQDLFLITWLSVSECAGRQASSELHLHLSPPRFSRLLHRCKIKIQFQNGYIQFQLPTMTKFSKSNYIQNNLILWKFSYLCAI